MLPKTRPSEAYKGESLSIPEDVDECWLIFEDDRTFHNAPYFNRDDAHLKFDTNDVGNANGNYGAVFVLR